MINKKSRTDTAAGNVLETPPLPLFLDDIEALLVFLSYIFALKIILFSIKCPVFLQRPLRPLSTLVSPHKRALRDVTSTTT